MRICVTIASDSPIIDEIYFYCQTNHIPMFPSSYIYVDHGYWLWRIEAPDSAALTWLLLKWSPHLAVF